MKDKSVSDTKLLTCPFCGGEAEVAWHCGHGYVAGCKDHMNCKTRGAYRIDEMSATEGWNRRAPGWIKCSDRMPANRKSVLIYNVFTEFVEIASYLEEEKRWMCWGDEDKEFQREVARFGGQIVTHWMPLPEMPKEVGVG